MIRALLVILFASCLAAPAGAADPVNGDRVFRTFCATCHNPGGSPGPDALKSGAGNPLVITTAFTSIAEMFNLDLVVSNSDVDDIAAYLFIRFGAAPPPSFAHLEPAAPNVAFGAVVAGTTSAARTLAISNSGGADATGVGIAVSNAAEFVISANGCGATLAAGAACFLDIAYAPTAAGADSAALVVSYAGGSLVVNLSGIGTPAPAANLQATPPLAAFGNVTVGQASAATTFAVTNTGSAAASSVALANSNAVEFIVRGNTCGASLAAGSTCVFQVAYQPAAAGTGSATLTITYAGGSAASIALSGTGVAIPPPPTTAVAIEYHNAGFDHYFVTHIADEITKLDNGTFVGWTRTGHKFSVYVGADSGLAPVCRFFSAAFSPKSSHFYAASASECTVVKASPDWQFEGEVFFVGTPAADGTCAPGTLPLYRLYNNGMGAAPNHRFTTELSVWSEMKALGWIPEGQGVGVAMCVPA